MADQTTTKFPADVAYKKGAAGVATAVDDQGNALPVTDVTPTGAASATFFQGFKTVAATNTPELMAASSTKVSSVVIQGYKAQGTLNTGNVYIGSSASDATDPIAIVPGGSLTIDAPPGKFIDLNTLYIDVATAADGVGYFGVV